MTEEGSTMAQKFVYFFGNGQAEGWADMKNLLGGNGGRDVQHRPAGSAGLHHYDRGLYGILQKR